MRNLLARLRSSPLLDRLLPLVLLCCKRVRISENRGLDSKGSLSHRKPHSGNLRRRSKSAYRGSERRLTNIGSILRSMSCKECSW